ncbi:MAG: hypothetical protein K0S04_4422 [Herbinix sp.]|jgi:sedoheptulokinase|nr:hypothetical protein [Herbinix sp.]
MKSIGLDIGTTTVCGIVIDTMEGNVICSHTLSNDSAVKGGDSFERLQDVNRILEICNQIVDGFISEYDDITNIGVTGQMHGILYLDSDGKPLSPLYTWQDKRGDLIYKDQITYSEYMTQQTGYQMATGYGLTTHFYQCVNDKLQKEAVCLCTVPDFIAMRLAEKKRPIMHKSMAASLGLFSVENGRFDELALEKLKLGTQYLPEVAELEAAYEPNSRSIIVSMALGDNQASFLGSVSLDSNILVNIGTGSQISIYAEAYQKDIEIEYRPYINNTYLMVGAPLCGGAAYELLKNFYVKVLELFQCEIPKNLYELMNEAANSVYNTENPLVVDTRFNGTRSNPKKRGSIEQLNGDNFTPEALTLGMLQGMCNELYEIYQKVPKSNQDTKALIGSGNGIRKNPVLQKVVEDIFGKELYIPIFGEEASCGAALYSLYSSGYFQSLEEIKKVVQTKKGWRIPSD